MMLYFAGRWEAIKKNWLQATVAGLIFSLTALILTFYKNPAG